MSLFKNVLLVSALMVAPAYAQKLVKIDVDAGSQASITYDNGSGDWTRIKTDINQDGEIEIVVPEGVTKVRIGKYSDGEWIRYEAEV